MTRSTAFPARCITPRRQSSFQQWVVYVIKRITTDVAVECFVPSPSNPNGLSYFSCHLVGVFFEDFGFLPVYDMVFNCDVVGNGRFVLLSSVLDSLRVALVYFFFSTFSASFWCSLSLTPNALPVSPTYDLSQPLHVLRIQHRRFGKCLAYPSGVLASS